MKTNLLNTLALLGAFGALLAGAPNASAADITWTGGDSTPTPNWSIAANWSPSVPTNGDNVIFTNALQQVNNNDLTGLRLGWLIFDQSGFSIAGNTLALTGGISNSVNAAGATVGLNLSLSNALPFISDSGVLALSGAINLSSNSLTLQGAGDFSWVLNDTQGPKGNGSVIKNSAGTVTVTGGATATYTGHTIVNAGTYQNSAATWSANSGVGASLTINPGAIFNNTVTHFMSYNGRPLTNYGGTFTSSGEFYVGNIVLSNASFSVTPDFRCPTDAAQRNIIVLAAPNPSTMSGRITLSTAYGAPNDIGSRTFVVANGAADPDLICSADPIAISGPGPITKTGPGKMRLDAPAVHTGSTTISEGTLAIGSGGSLPSTSAIFVNTNAVFDVGNDPFVSFSLGANVPLTGGGLVLGTMTDQSPGAAIYPGTAGTAGTLTIETLNLDYGNLGVGYGGNLSLNFDLGTNNLAVGGGTNDLLVVTNLTLSTALTNRVNINAIGGALKQGVPYTIIRYTTGPAAGPVPTLAGPSSHLIYTFAATGNSITVTITGTPYDLTWKGDGAANLWDTTSTNWLVSGVTPDRFFEGDNATFNDVGSNTPAINIPAVVRPTTFTVNSSKDYTFVSYSGAGKVSGPAVINKSGSGNLTINTDNDNVGGGTLGGSGTVYVGGSVGNLGSGNIINNTKVVITRLNNVTSTANLSGTGSILVDTPATIGLAGASAQAGGLTIKQGIVHIGSSAAAVAGSLMNGPITNYGTLFFSRSDAFTLPNRVTGVGNTGNYGLGDVHIRGAGGMTVDGTAPLDTGTSGSLNVGQSINGMLTVAPGGVVNVGQNFLAGNPTHFRGETYQTGGTVDIGGYARIGHWNNTNTSFSSYNISAGILNVTNNYLAVGWDGIGLMTLSGTGTINTRQLLVDGNTATAAISGTNSTFTMTGGNLNIGAGGISGNTATVRLSGGTIAASAPTGFTADRAMILTNGTPTIDTGVGTVTLSGVLSGNGGLTKTGAGILNLNATNTYSGTTTVNAGILQGNNGVVSGPLVVNNAVLSAGGTLATGTLTVSNTVTINPGGALLFDLYPTATTSDLLNVQGALALNNTPISFNFLGGVPSVGATYTVVNNSGLRTGTHSFVNPTRYTITDLSDANAIKLSFSGANANLVWNGNVSGAWDVNTTANWLNGAAPGTFYQSDNVVFNNTGSARPNVSLAGALTPAGMAVDGSTSYTLSGGTINTVGGLVKSGTGTFTLATDAAFGAGGTVNGGTLQIGNGGTAGTFTGNIANNGATVAFNRSTASTYGGVISGNGLLSVSGAGILTLTANQLNTGGTLINGGASLQLGNGSALTDAGWLGIGPVNNNGTLTFFRPGSAVMGSSISGSGALVFKGTGAALQSAYTLMATNNFTGPVTVSKARLQTANTHGSLALGNPSSITVLPGSTLYCTAPVTMYSYTTTPQYRFFNAPLILSGMGWNENALYGALRLNNGTIWTGPITLAGNTRISSYSGITETTADNRIQGTISGAGYEVEFGVGSAGGLLTLEPSSPNTFGSVRLNGSTLVLGNANALPSTTPLIASLGTLRLNGNIVAPSTYTHLGTVGFQNYSTVSAAQLILPLTANANFSTFSDGPNGIGSATGNALPPYKPLHVTISGTSETVATIGSVNGSWSGNLTNNGAFLTTGVASGFGRGGAINPNRVFVVNNGGTLRATINDCFGGSAQYAPPIILNNSTLTTTRYNSINDLTLNGGTVTGTVSDTGAYAGWQIGNNVTVGGSTASTMSMQDGKNFYLRAPATVFNVADATGNANADLVVGTPLAGSSGNFSGVVAGLTKTGAGKMQLNGVSAYTGPTIVAAGTLALGASGTLGYGAIVVSNSATLDVSAASAGLTLGINQSLSGSGTIVGNVTDNSGTLIRPGTSAGTLTIQGNLSLGNPSAGGSTGVEIELASVTTVGAGINDLIQVNGNLSLNNSAPTWVNFRFLNGTPAAGTYTIMKYTGTLSGTAAGLTNAYNATITINTTNKEVRATFSTTPAQTLVWRGDGFMNAWDNVTNSVNWFNSSGSVLTNFYPLDSVRFDDTSANTMVSINETVSPSSVTVDSTAAYTLSGSGKITGSGTLTKSNTGLLDITTANNDFSGGLVVNGGLVQLGADQAFGPVSIGGSGKVKLTGGTTPLGANGQSVTITSGGQFDYNGTTFGSDYTRRYNFTITGSGPDGTGAIINSSPTPIYSYANIGTLNLGGDATVGGDGGRWDIGPGAGTKLDGGGYKLVKAGTHVMSMRPEIITNVNSITITNGRLYYEGYDRVTPATATMTNIVSTNGILSSYGRILNMPVVADGGAILGEVRDPQYATWTGPIYLKSTGTLYNWYNQLFTGEISGPGTLVASAWLGQGYDLGNYEAGSLMVSNSYTGGTIISNAPHATTSYGAPAIWVGHPNALGTGPVTIDGTAFANSTIGKTNNIFLPIAFICSNNVVVPNDIILPVDTRILNNSLQGHDWYSRFTLAGKISGGHAGLTNFLNFYGAGGVMRWSNPANDFVAAEQAVAYGVLAITHNGCLGNPANALSLRLESLQSQYGIRLDGNNINLSRNFINRSGGVLYMYGDNNGDGVPDTANSATISGTVSGTGSLFNIRGLAGCVLTLTGNNTYSGSWELLDPVVLQVSSSTNLGTAAVALKAGTLRYTGTGSETMTRRLDHNNATLWPGTIDITSPTAFLTWNPSAGVMDQPWIKTGPGTLALGMNMLGTTPVTVNAGTLYANGTYAGNPVSVTGTGTTLGGSGTINGTVTLAAGTHLKPGNNGIGTLTLGAPVSLEGVTTTMELNAATGSDRLAGLMVTYGGTLTVLNTGTQSSLTNGAKFTLFSSLIRAGAFSSVSLPPLDAGLVWDNKIAVDGTIQVVSAVNRTPVPITVVISGGQINMSWPPDHLGWTLQSQTNTLNMGVNPSGTWYSVPGSTTVTNWTITPDPAQPTVFYRLYIP